MNIENMTSDEKEKFFVCTLDYMKNLQSFLGDSVGNELFNLIISDDIKNEISMFLLRKNINDIKMSLTISFIPDGKLVHAIKIIREHTGMGLKDAKDAVDTVLGHWGKTKSSIAVECENINKLNLLKSDLQKIGAKF